MIYKLNRHAGKTKVYQTEAVIDTSICALEDAILPVSDCSTSFAPQLNDVGQNGIRKTLCMPLDMNSSYHYMKFGEMNGVRILGRDEGDQAPVFMPSWRQKNYQFTINQCNIIL
ncbi:hypothetical protein [Listeria booriae]|uniref:hypothetical protein n=1 Tax=Listeria booriae TaxID=1552123 RepID=UPI001624CCD8|nr:hypothetical protein [Listeria booriae]MBC2258850.1 hypothetical protein [Listeria booriae]